MQVAFCENCGKFTGHKRSVGVIGAVTALATVGANLLAYSPRCVVCGLTVEQARRANPAKPVAMPASRFCSGCGKPSTTAFCAGCGTAAPAPQSTVPAAAVQPGRLIPPAARMPGWLVVLIVLACLMILPRLALMFAR